MRRVAVAAAVALLVAGARADAETRLSSSARNSLNQTISLSYSVTGIGLSVLSAEFAIKFARDHYQATSVVKTEGIAGLLMASRWDTRAEGAITATGLRPATYRSDVSTSRGRGAVEVAWEENAFRVSALPSNKPDRIAKLREALTIDIPDPLTGVITTALFSASKPCTGSQRVFDGRRIYDLTFRLDGGLETVSGPNYKGPAYRCSVKHTPVAGQPADELADERRRPSPHHPMWLAPIELGSSGLTVLIPVKIHLSTDWATTVVDLTASTIDGEPLHPAAD